MVGNIFTRFGNQIDFNNTSKVLTIEPGLWDISASVDWGATPEGLRIITITGSNGPYAINTQVAPDMNTTESIVSQISWLGEITSSSQVEMLVKIDDVIGLVQTSGAPGTYITLVKLY